MAKQVIVKPDSLATPHTFAELAVGDCCTEILRISERMFEGFIDLSEDRALAHLNDVHAQQMGYARRIVHGFLTTLRFSRLLGMFMPGPWSVIHTIRFDYRRPIMIGDELTYSVAVKRLSEATKAVVLDLEVKRADETCVRGTAQCILMK